MRRHLPLGVIYLLVVWSSFHYSSPALLDTVYVGAVFHPEIQDHQDIAFQYSVDRVNMDRQLLPYTTLLVKEVNTSWTDSFTTGRRVCDMSGNRLTAVFGPYSPSTSSIVRSICENLGVPNIQAHWDMSHRPPGRCHINIHPDHNTMEQAYETVVKEYLQWKSFAILYESDDALKRLQSVLQIHGPGDPPVTIRKIIPGGDNRPLLKEMYNFTETHIIVDCDTNNVISLLQQAKEVGMMGDYQGYFITSLDAHTLDWSEFLHHQTNLTFLRIVDPSRAKVQNAIQDWGYNERRYGRVLDLRPETVRTEAALMYDAVQVFAKALHEVDLAENVKMPSLSCDSEEPWDYGPTIIDYMKQLEFPGMTGMVRFDEEGHRTDLSLDVVEVYRDGVTKTAVWDSINGLSLVRSYNDTLAEVQRNVQDKIFIVASIIGEPYLTYTKPLGEYTGNDRFEGYSKDLIEAIAENLKFKGYQLILARDGKNGGIDANTKKWNGLIRELLEMKADIAICDLTITYDRRNAVDFTMPFMNLGISILFSQLPKEPPNVFSFLKPFSFDVWLCMATAYLGVSIILFVLCRLTPYEWDNPHPCDPDPEELENSFNMLNCLWFSIGSLMAAGCDILPKMSPFEWKITQPNKGQPQVLENNQTFHNCVWHNMGSLMQQGSDIAPQAVSTRMLAGMWWFFVLILNASYTANLAAFLTTGRIEETITNVQELADQTKVKYGVMEGGSTAGFFSKSDNPLYQRMWVQMAQSKPSVFVKSNDEGVARVRKERGRFAYFMESSSIGYQMHKYCDLMQVGMELDSKSYGIALPLNSPYRSLINKAILELQESGNLSKIKTKWWEKAGGDCFKDPAESKVAVDSNELGISNVAGVFWVVIIGTGTAFFVASCELLWNCRKIAVEEKVTPWKAIVAELKFALNFSNQTKPVNLSHGGSESESSEDSFESNDAENQLEN